MISNVALRTIDSTVGGGVAGVVVIGIIKVLKHFYAFSCSFKAIKVIAIHLYNKTAIVIS
jgi:hypothetical protein